MQLKKKHKQVLLVEWLLWVADVVVAEVTHMVLMKVDVVQLNLLSHKVTVDVVVTNFHLLKSILFCPSVLLHLGKTIYKS
jgi:hypothetical protein